MTLMFFKRRRASRLSLATNREWGKSGTFFISLCLLSETYNGVQCSCASPRTRGLYMLYAYVFGVGGYGYYTEGSRHCTLSHPSSLCSSLFWLPINIFPRTKRKSEAWELIKFKPTDGRRSFVSKAILICLV